MAGDLLRAEPDVAVAEWIAPRLGELGSVAGTAPEGFEAYVRVIGGSSELAQALLRAAELEAWLVEPGDLLTAEADEINHVGPAE